VLLKHIRQLSNVQAIGYCCFQLVSFIRFICLGHFLLSTAIRFPVDKTNVTGTIAPTKVTLDRLLLFFVTEVISIIYSRFPKGRKMALNPIEPGNIGGYPVELDLVPGSII
jgi:hypothetical protein